jgi:AsmA-like C-terminal region
MSTSSTSPPQTHSAIHGRGSGNRKLLIAAVGLGLIFCALALALSHWWPFRQPAIIQNLSEAGDSQVTARSFRETYFPPGCVLEGVAFRRGTDAKPLITIDRLTIVGSYHGLISQSVNRLTADGMHVFIPAFGTASQAFHTSPSKITINEIVANGSTIEFASSDPAKEPLRFDVREASLKNVGWNGPLAYQVRVHNPEPPGEVTAQGKFGVWNKDDPGNTPISGQYKFEQADLSIYRGIAGTLSSTGQFSGKLSHIDISGSTATPDFEVKESGHRVQLATKFSAYVDATKGDTFLNRVDADFWKTHLVAQGSIAGSSGRDGKSGKGKIALIELHSNKARIEDLLRLFVKANRAPMSGNVTLQARVEIPPGEEKFLEKVKLQGAFGISGGTFSETTQQNVDKLSAGARGEKIKDPEKDKDDKNKDKNKEETKDQPDLETVLTDLKGQVSLLNATAHFSDLSFGVPGAAARMQGTYNLLNHKIDLRGQLKVDTKISDTTTGGKAFLLKMMDPFFKKKRKGEVVPVRISGTYEHPSFGLDLNDNKAKQKSP